MGEIFGMTQLAAAELLSEPLQEPFPHKFRIGAEKYAYEYTWPYGWVWKRVRAAIGNDTTGPMNKLFLIKLDQPGGAERAPFTFLAVRSPDTRSRC